jgi:excinuclease ABC subunit C
MITPKSQPLAKSAVDKFPEEPGVYFFRAGKQILYIGKATFLRARVRSYWSKDLAATRGPKLVAMLAEATRVDYKVTGSVLEALLLEAALIRKHQPVYNTLAKDDKSFYYVVVTKEEWPRVLLVRGKDLAQPEYRGADQFGPFPQASELRIALKLVRAIFPFRDFCLPAQAGRPTSGKLCFNAQIGLCPGVCAGKITAAEYRRSLQPLRLFFAGRGQAAVKLVTERMKTAAQRRDFEEAATWRDRLFALTHVQDIALLKKRIENDLPPNAFRIEAFDAAHLGGRAAVGAMIVWQDGDWRKNDYRKFKLHSRPGDDLASLREVLRRRLAHAEWPLPNLIVIDGGETQLKTARAALAKYPTIPIVSVVKNEKHKARELLGDPDLSARWRQEIIGANAEVHRFAIAYHRNRRSAEFLPRRPAPAPEASKPGRGGDRGLNKNQPERQNSF